MNEINKALAEVDNDEKFDSLYDEMRKITRKKVEQGGEMTKRGLETTYSPASSLKKFLLKQILNELKQLAMRQIERLRSILSNNKDCKNDMEDCRK